MKGSTYSFEEDLAFGKEVLLSIPHDNSSPFFFCSPSACVSDILHCLSCQYALCARACGQPLHNRDTFRYLAVDASARFDNSLCKRCQQYVGSEHKVWKWNCDHDFCGYSFDMLLHSAFRSRHQHLVHLERQLDSRERCDNMAQIQQHAYRSQLYYNSDCECHIGTVVESFSLLKH